METVKEERMNKRLVSRICKLISAIALLVIVIVLIAK